MSRVHKPSGVVLPVLQEAKFCQLIKSTRSKKAKLRSPEVLICSQKKPLYASSTFCGLIGKKKKYTLAALAAIFNLGLVGVSNTFASSISISLSGNVSLNLLKDNSQPVFGTSTTATANVTSDHFTGYTLTIQGANDSGKLENGDGSRYLTSIGEAISRNTFETDSNYNDKWGFLPSKYNSIDNNYYQSSPIHTTPTTIDVTNTPTSNSGNNYTLALGAKVTPSMSLDSYGQTFVLAATGNGYDYHIGYTDDATTIPADQYEAGASSNTVTLSNTRPTKDGFVFQGWCDQPTTVNPSTFVTTCPSGANTYQPGATITLDGTTGNNINLHAIWAKGYDNFAAAFAAAGKSQSGGYYQMQDMTSAICDSVVIGSPYVVADITKNTLIDTRNNKTYLVAKYADGHCWMRENLNYVFTAGGTVVAYNFQTGQTFNYTTTYATQTSTGTAWAQDASDGTRSFQQNKDNCIGGTDINTSGGTGATCDANKPYERIGVLYNWAAATAQTGAQAAAAGSSGETTVTTSICPKGWRLPANSGDYSFSVLMGSYGLPTTNQGSLTSANNYSGQLQNPLNFNRPGNYVWSNGALTNRGTNGHFWSSVGYSSTCAHYLDFHSTYFYPQNGNNKGHGLSVRCVAV